MPLLNSTENTMTNLFDTIERQGLEKLPADAVIKEDGLVYCPLCDTPIQCRQTLLGKEYIMPCLCDCGADKHRKLERERDERLRIEETQRKRNMLLTLPKYLNMTFENSDTDKTFALNYVKNFPKYKEQNLGLLLWGNRGTGKTFDAASIANALIDKGYSAYMATINHMASLAGDFNHGREFFERIKTYDLLVVDDFGADRGSDYTAELIYNIIDTRICSLKPIVVTTNLSPKEMAECSDLKTARIFDRILEACHPVEYDGDSRRLCTGRNRYLEIERELNIK